MQNPEILRVPGSELRLEPLTMPGVALGEENRLPPVHRLRNVQHSTASQLGEEDGLYLNFGSCPGVFPYPYQDNYTRELTDRTYQCVILENEFLRAEFLPELGGRLWSLRDKKRDKELLFRNPVFRVSNLANRNAWFSGGVEFNFGPVGHHPHTCETMHTALLKLDDGTPVLRMYHFERIRAAVYQMDFWLPAASEFLFVRVRLFNPNNRVIPAYWWSNIAVPSSPDRRVVVAADSAYSHGPKGVYRMDVPIREGADITYPENSPGTIDYFWNIPAERRKYLAYPDKEGHGLLQCSTNRLQGRKLFVWGQAPGGKNWQRFLSGAGCDGAYAEIQAGIAKTQYESLPMPPGTAWEWLEAYGAMDMEPAQVHESWHQAQEQVEYMLDRRLPLERMEQILADTRAMARRPAEKQLLHGTPWGALENLRRERAGQTPFCPYLDFGPLEDAQSYWLYLLDNGRLPEGERELPPSYMAQPEWTALLERAAASSGQWDWELALHLGLIALSEDRLTEGRAHLLRSMELRRNPGALFGLSVYYDISGDAAAAADYALGAARMLPEDPSFAKAAAQRLLGAGQYKQLLTLLEERPWMLENNRIKMLKACALLKLGDPEGSEALLMENGGLDVPDVREGETSVTQLWLDIQTAKARLRGEALDPADLCPPPALDFRAYVPPKK